MKKNKEVKYKKLKSLIYLKQDYLNYLFNLLRKHNFIKLEHCLHTIDYDIQYIKYEIDELKREYFKYFYDDEQFTNELKTLSVMELFKIIDFLPEKYKKDMVWE